MPLNRKFFFPTLVLLFSFLCFCESFAAITDPSPDIDDSQNTTEIRKLPDPQVSETLDISIPPPTDEPLTPKREYFHPYRQSITMRGGLTFGSGQGANTILGGVQFQFTNTNLKIFEASADLMTDGKGAISFAQRWNFTRSRFRPYAKAGGGLLVNPGDGIAFVVNFKNYRIGGSIGAEYLIRKAQSIRMDFEAAISTNSFLIVSSLGYVWAW